MILGYLIFTHLVGDFVLQPESLVEWKMKNVKGVLVHVLIHFIVGTAVLLPFILHGYWWLICAVFVISFLHFWIDQAKINYNLKHDKKVRPFIIDQMLHLLAILVVYFFIGNVQFILPATVSYRIYTDINLVMFCSFLIFSTTVVETYRYQFVHEKNAKAKLNLNPEKILKRISVFTMIYALFMLLAYYAPKI